MLAARGLGKRLDGRWIVDRIDLRVAPGEVVGILGANGAGKSTTVRMLTGLLRPTEGQVLFRGQSITEDPIGFRRRLGYVPEEANVYPHLSVGEWLSLSAELREIPSLTRRVRIRALLGAFGLAAEEHTPLGACSKGQRQRTLLAAALLHDPDVLVLDEPLSGLDVDFALAFRSLVTELAARGKAILLASHALELVERTCRSVVVLDCGRVVREGDVQTLRGRLQLRTLEEIYRSATSGQVPEEGARAVVAAMSAS